MGKNMKRMNTSYLIAITLVIVGLMTTSTAVVPAEKNVNSLKINVVKSTAVAHSIMVSTMHAAAPVQQPSFTPFGTPVFAGDGNQKHPAMGRALTGVQVAAYRDEAVNSGQIIYTFSTDEGATYDPGVYFTNENDGDYPSVKYWGANTYFGTFVSNFNDLNGGATYLFGTTDPTSYDAYSLLYWDWSSYGWNDMRDGDIACDNSRNTWEWGMSSYVMSSTYNDGTHPEGYTQGPTLVFPDPASETQGWISWYYGFDGCAHTDIDIDHVTKMGYAVYDKLIEGSWKLTLRQKDFSDVINGTDNMYNVSVAGNFTNPAVATHAGSILILAELNQTGTKDVVCLYGRNNNVTNLQTSVVATGAQFPDIRHVQNDRYQATFIKNGKLYKTNTTDAGVTWSTPEEVGDVAPEYKSSDLADYGVKAFYEVNNGADLDIWLADIGAGPLAPKLEITIQKGFGLGVKATIKNNGTAPATNVRWDIKATGGILGKINSITNGTIPSLAIGASEPISSPMIMGLGTITVVVTATCDEGSIATATSPGTQLIIFTIIK
jgi:hypothetical protein